MELLIKYSFLAEILHIFNKYYRYFFVILKNSCIHSSLRTLHSSLKKDFIKIKISFFKKLMHSDSHNLINKIYYTLKLVYILKKIYLMHFHGSHESL